MSRPEARDVILTEIFVHRDSGQGSTPTPTDVDASAATTGGLPSWVVPTGGLVLALGIGYGLHKITSRDTSPR